MELAIAHGVSLDRRLGHRRLVGARTGLHCRTRSGQVAREASRRVPIQPGSRDTGGLHFELPHSAYASGCGGVALAGRHCRGPRIWVSGPAVQHSTKPALVCIKEPNGEALEVLRLMGEPNPEGELAEIRTALDQEHTTAHEPVFRWKYRYPLFLAITIGAFNQLAGINAILYYLNNIFAAAGFSQISGDQQAIAIGFTNLIFTMVGMSVIDKQGRKTLLLIGAAGTATCLAGVAWIFTSNSHQSALVFILVAYIAFFTLSQGAVIWVHIGEVFPNHVRSKGRGAGNPSHWIMNNCIALVFPTVAANIGRGAPFVFFSAMTVLQFLVVLFAYPETKGQSLEQMQLRLVKA
jgi:Sugar (and other) transporter